MSTEVTCTVCGRVFRDEDPAGPVVAWLEHVRQAHPRRIQPRVLYEDVL